MLRSVLILLVAAVASPSATAQLDFELADPLVVIDGMRAQVEGAPLRQRAFGALLVEAPGWGRLRVSDVPFPGARRAGDFDRTRLVVVLGGRSLRLRSSTPLLSAAGPVPAYARLEADVEVRNSGPVRLSLAPSPVSAAPAERSSTPGARDAEGRQRDAHAQTGVAQFQADIATLRAEQANLRAALADAQREAASARRERDAARRQFAALRDERLSSPPTSSPSSEERTAARVSIPDADLARLDNPGEIRARLEDTPYPEWAAASGLGGDVLVLFQTDTRGTVVRTAVPRPIGGGLDAVAEEIVRAMRFRPARADGQATRLRSQVVVRFKP